MQEKQERKLPREEASAPIPQPRREGPVFRALRAEEVQVQVVKVSAERATLAFKPRHKAMVALLDEARGTMGWGCGYYAVGSKAYCRVGILDEDSGELLYKSAGPGGASGRLEEDEAFDRAAARWGAGRDVWALPAISLSSESLVIAPVERNGRLAGYEVKDSLSVRDIIRDEEGILAMVLVNQSGKVLKWEARR